MRLFSDSPEKAARDASSLTEKWLPEVLKKEAELLAGADDMMAAMQQELKRQRQGWWFTCRRFGDFLSLEIERRSNPAPAPWPHPCSAPPAWARDERRYAGTINLAKVSGFALEDGKAPDNSGIASFYISESRRAENPNGPWKRYEWLEVSGPPSPPEHRPFFAPRPARRVHSQGFCHNKINHVTSGLAYPAEDDRLVFSGWETLLVPTGLGRSVLDALHAELDRGWPIREAPQ